MDQETIQRLGRNLSCVLSLPFFYLSCFSCYMTGFFSWCQPIKAHDKDIFSHSIVPIHNEWDRALPLLHTDTKQTLEEDTNCGDIMFKKDIMPW